MKNKPTRPLTLGHALAAAEQHGGHFLDYMKPAAGEAAHTPTLPRFAVMACPDYAGKHPFHDQRWIVTEGTEIERGHDLRPGQWATRNGSLVAEMRDCELGTAAAIVRACNSHAQQQQALEDAARAFDSIARALHLGQTVSISSVQNCAAKARAALAAAKEGQP